MKTLKDKIIAKQDEYIAYLTKAIKSESIIEAITAGVRSSYESELSRLKDEGEGSAEQSDKLTAEDVLKDFISKCRDYSCNSSDISKKRYSFTVAQLCELMEAYHSQFVGENVTDMRKELITFLKEYHKSMFVIDLENSKIDYEEVINEYLKTR